MEKIKEPKGEIDEMRQRWERQVLRCACNLARQLSTKVAGAHLHVIADLSGTRSKDGRREQDVHLKRKVQIPNKTSLIATEKLDEGGR